MVQKEVNWDMIHYWKLKNEILLKQNYEKYVIKEKIFLKIICIL